MNKFTYLQIMYIKVFNKVYIFLENIQYCNVHKQIYIDMCVL